MLLRLWVIEHFRVLPTDPRYKELTEDQIDVLFTAFLTRPTDLQLQRTYWESKTDVEELPVDQFKEMGYDEAQIAEIAEGVRQIYHE